MSKRILLVNENPTFRQLFIKGIREQGIDVVDLYEDYKVNYKKTVLQKVKNLFYVRFFGDRDYYKRKFNAKRDFALQQIINKKTDFYDHILVFRADMFSEAVLHLLRKKSSSMVAYQYDGMSICQNLVPNIPLFDEIFTFDFNDQMKYNFKGITNCWFDDDKKDTSEENHLFYVGVGVPDRISKIKKVSDYCKAHELKLKAHLTIQSYLPESNINGVALSSKSMSYKENINNLKKCKAVIDFKLDRHDGLSFRFFEALYYKKKIITNNKTIMNYDFYHPNNILVTDFDDLSNIADFLNLPYTKLDSKIIEKYSVSNWIKNVFNIIPNNKIELPKYK